MAHRRRLAAADDAASESSDTHAKRFDCLRRTKEPSPPAGSRNLIGRQALEVTMASQRVEDEVLGLEGQYWKPPAAGSELEDMDHGGGLGSRSRDSARLEV